MFSSLFNNNKSKSFNETSRVENPTLELLSPPGVDPKTGAVTVSLRVSPQPANGKVAYAAAPPPDRRFSFSGSGLPFPNVRVALESNRASRGVANVEIDGSFVAVLECGMPGAYYTTLGSKLLDPQIHVTYLTTNGDRVRLSVGLGVDPLPYRSLNHAEQRDKKGPGFYNHSTSRIKDIVRSQDQILKDTAWNARAPGWNRTVSDYWRGV